MIYATETSAHPIERAQALVETAPLLAADFALTAFGQTRGHRGEPETEFYTEVLSRAVLAATGVPLPAGAAPVATMLSERGCERLACAALLRLLVLDDTVFDDVALRRDTVALFDRTLAKRVYGQLQITTKTQTFEKQEALRTALLAEEAALTTHVESLRSLEALGGFRQQLNKLFQGGVTAAAIRPFLPDEVTMQTLNEVLAAAQAACAATDEEAVARASVAAATLEPLRAAIDGTPTGLASQVLGAFADRIDAAVKAHVRARGLAEPARLRMRAPAKRYPLTAPGAPITLRLVVTNDGPGQARELRVAVHDATHVHFNDPERSLGWVPPGEADVAVHGSVVQPGSGDVVMVRLTWRDPDGSERVAEELVDLDAQDEAPDWDALSYESPYDTDAVTDPSRFVGRSGPLRDLARIALAASPGSARIEGQRRVGKTSLALALPELVDQLRPTTYAFVHLQTGDFSTVDGAQATLERLGQVIADRARAADERLASVPSPSFAGGLAPLTDFFADAARVAPDRRFIVVLDEFDALPHPDLYARGGIGDAFFQTLRGLASKPNVGFVLVGGERMRFVIAARGQELNKFRLVPVDYFEQGERDDFARLIRDPVEAWLDIAEEAIDVLHHATAGNPWVAKLVANEMFERQVQRRDRDVRREDAIAAVDVAVRKLSASSFAHFWDDAINGDAEQQQFVSVTRRKVLLAAADCLRAGRPLTDSTVGAAARRFALEPATTLDVLRGLRERRILLADAEGRMSCRVPLFERWLAEEGAHEIVVTMGDDDVLIRRHRVEEAQRPRSDELDALVASWRTHAGQPLDAARIRQWLGQFGGPREQRLMLTMLQRLRYFNQQQTRERLRELHGFVVRTLAGTGYKYRFEGRQRSRGDLLVTALDGGGSGASALLRPYRDENSILAERVVDHGEVPAVLAGGAGGVRAIVVVEDFIGSGGTARKALHELYAAWTTAGVPLDELEVFVLAISGFDKALGRVRSVLRDLEWDPFVHVAVPLDDTDRIFGDSSRTFPDEDERELARTIAFERGAALEPKHPLGFDDSQAPVCFESRCPNNAPPVLWKAASGWIPLFAR